MSTRPSLRRRTVTGRPSRVRSPCRSKGRHGQGLSSSTIYGTLVPEMARGDAWRKHLEEHYPTQEAKEAFRHEVEALTAVAQLLESVQALQKGMNVSKAEIARRLSKPRPNVSRLFAEDSNPTLVTLFELFAALGVGAEVKWHALAEGEPLLRISPEALEETAADRRLDAVGSRA
jgi:transcriptional regulator with XRE-family HTH domain